jgi:S-DNA-T family DNA segregation ATPase FtsK/SpoIIIE
VDRPDIQTQLIGVYEPAVDGSLLVVGGGRAGKSTLLATIGAARSSVRSTRVPATLPGLWDALTEALRAVQLAPSSADDRPHLLIVDDLDRILSTCTDEYGAALIDLLSRVLREGPARGIWAVVAVQRVAGALQGVSSLCNSVLMMRMPNRQEHLLAGGVSAEFSDVLPPGAAHWRGRRIQVLRSPSGDSAAQSTDRSVESGIDPNRPLAVVSSRPRDVETEIRAMSPGTSIHRLDLAPPGSIDPSLIASGALGVVIGDADAWQTHWAAFGAVRGRIDVLFDGCSVADFRALTRLRELPPPAPHGERARWMLRSDGDLARARFGSVTPARS